MILRLYIAQHLWVLTVICNAPVACLHRILSQQQLFQTVWPVGTESGTLANTPLCFDRSLHRYIHPASPAWKGWRPPSWSGQDPAVDPWYGPVRELNTPYHESHYVIPRHNGQLYYIPMQALNINTVETPLQSQAMAFCRRVRRVNSGKGSWNRDRAVPQLKHNTKGTRVHCVECRP